MALLLFIPFGAGGGGGQQGPQGSQGPQGPQGAFGGPQGPQGAQGPQGFQGNQGNQGAQGSQGTQGFQGNQGVQGPQGNQGFQGVIGAQGPQGFQGNQGAQGPQGFQGVIGAQGPQGFQGVQGSQGNQGAQGPQGFQGVIGAQGPQGFQGDVGAQGPQGFQGNQGFQGDVGAQGPQGFQGDVGAQGPQGFQGNQGFQGASGGDPLLTVLDIYVAPATAAVPGNDANSGLTPLLPVLTMAGAYSKIPSHNFGLPVRIHTAAFPLAPLAWTPIPDALVFAVNGQLIVVGDGAGQAGETGFQAPVAAGVAGAATTATFLDFPAAVDAFLGMTLRNVTTGALATIRNNTALGIVPDHAIAGMAPGDSFEVLRPATIIDISAAATRVCAGSNASYPTLINIGITGGGSTNALVADNIACLKLYGVVFDAAAELSVTNSNVFAGVTATDTSVHEDIHFAELVTAITGSVEAFAALGSPANWAGWGVSNIDSSLNSQGYTLDAITGYVVSFSGLFIGGLPGFGPSFTPTPALLGFKLTILGGYFNAIIQSGEIEYRSGAGVPALAGSLLFTQTKGQVVGGDAALSLIQPAAIFSLVLMDSEFYWRGSMTMLGSGFNNPCIVNLGGKLVIQVADDEALSFNLGDNSIGIVTTRGETQIIDAFAGAGAPPTFTFDLGDNTVALANGAGARFFSNVADSLNELVFTSLPGLQNVALAVGNGGYGNTAIDCTNIGIPVLNAGIATIPQGIITACLTAALNENGQLTFDSDQPVTTINAPFVSSGPAAVALVQLTSTLSILGPSALVGAIQALDGASVQIGFTDLLTAVGVTGPTYLATEGSKIDTSFNNVMGEGPIVEARRLSNVLLRDAGVLTATVGAACVVRSGSQLVLGTGLTINAVTNGVDVTGGGEAIFEDGATVFVVGGDELIVGPDFGEQSTFINALPAAANSFSNSGSGSAITRVL